MLQGIINFIEAQDTVYARKVIETLCSKEFAGRGYTNKGDQKASQFISDQLKQNQIPPLGETYFQEFKLQASTITGDLSVKVDNKELIAGKDYIVHPSSPSIKGTYKLVYLDKSVFCDTNAIKLLLNKDLKNSFVVADTVGLNNKSLQRLAEGLIYLNAFKAKGIIIIPEKLSGYVSSRKREFPIIYVRREKLADKPEEINLKVHNTFLKNHKTRNVAGFLKGKSDSIIIFSAHYDHLGMMGKEVYFPGANDNAGGTALVLDLARHFSEQKDSLPYSVAFLFFTAEEIGLLGSSYFVMNPLLPMDKVKLLMNLDLVGTGDDGINIVNGTIFKDVSSLLDSLNQEYELVKEIKKRGEATNSDHYPFYASGVPSVFIYTLGGISEYHNIYDRPETLPLTDYVDFFRLINLFIHTF